MWTLSSWIMSVPSVAPRLNSLMAMKPLPPGRFSTTTGWPQARPSLSATRRDRPSGPPPTGKGLMMREDLVGHLALCAKLGDATAAAIAPSANAALRRLMLSDWVIFCLPGRTVDDELRVFCHALLISSAVIFLDIYAQLIALCHRDLKHLGLAGASRYSKMA